jgi:predicted transposase YbfD/YdcC
MTPKSERRRWASQEAAIKAEINEAKNTGDLLRMANAIVQLDALHAQMEAAAKSSLGTPS